MTEVPMAKRLEIVRLHLEGHSNQEVATLANSSKGTVGNVLTELRTGRLPIADSVADQAVLLHKIAAEMREYWLSPAEACIGFECFDTLRGSGIPAHEWPTLIRLAQKLADKEELDLIAFLHAGNVVSEFVMETGIDPVNVPATVANLEQELEQKRAEIKDVDACVVERDAIEQAIIARNAELAALNDDIAAAKSERDAEQVATATAREKGRPAAAAAEESAQTRTGKLEAREEVLTKRVETLEAKAAHEERRLPSSREVADAFEVLGVPIGVMQGVLARLEALSSESGVSVSDLRERLLGAVEDLEGEQELKRWEEAVAAVKADASTLETRAKILTSQNQVLTEKNTEIHAAVDASIQEIPTYMKSLM